MIRYIYPFSTIKLFNFIRNLNPRYVPVGTHKPTKKSLKGNVMYKITLFKESQRNLPRKLSRFLLFLSFLVFPLSQTALVYGQPAFPLKVSANKRYLVDQNNVPFLYHADTCWGLVWEMNKSEAETYLERRRQQGFTTIQAIALPFFSNEGNREGNKAFSPNTDLRNPNSAYFAHLDWVINKAAEKNLLVVLNTLWFGIEGNNWRSSLTNSNARVFGRYLGQRYKNFPNIIWFHGGDDDPGDKIDEVRELAAGIREHDTQHLQSYHAYKKLSTAAGFDSDTWLGIDMGYSYGNTHSQILSGYNNTSPYTRPVVMGEGLYETAESGATPQRMRAQAYWTFLSGGSGHAYGHHKVWRAPSGWQNHLNSSGATSMTHFKNLFFTLEWYKLVPDQNNTLVTAGKASGNTYATAARASDGSFGLLYMPTSRSVTVNMAQVNDNTTARWYNPSNGSYTTISGSPFHNSGSRTFSPPSNGDWVLVLKAGAAPTPEPELTYTLQLKENWNLISLPIDPSDDDIADVLAPINGMYSAVHAYNGKEYESYYSGNASSTLKKMEAGRGYWIFMNQAGSLQVKGKAAGKSITFNKDWNLVGYNSTTPMSASQALASTGGKVTVLYSYNSATNTYEVAQTLEPGVGYWMFASEGGTWTLP
jgi:hypothetical protein